jgi:hypothetical protein
MLFAGVTTLSVILLVPLEAVDAVEFTVAVAWVGSAAVTLDAAALPLRLAPTADLVSWESNSSRLEDSAVSRCSSAEGNNRFLGIK